LEAIGNGRNAIAVERVGAGQVALVERVNAELTTVDRSGVRAVVS